MDKIKKLNFRIRKTTLVINSILLIACTVFIGTIILVSFDLSKWFMNCYEQPTGIIICNK